MKPLVQIDAGIGGEDGPLPADFSDHAALPAVVRDIDAVRGPGAPPTVLHWAASELRAQPAYFDHVPLERYGQSVCPIVQPLLSGARFFGTFPIIPYKIGIDRTHDRIYTLGYYRPGSPAPCIRQTLPVELDAALLESGSWIGLVLLLP
jgi:hypothetical protein